VAGHGDGPVAGGTSVPPARLERHHRVKICSLSALAPKDLGGQTEWRSVLDHHGRARKPDDATLRHQTVRHGPFLRGALYPQATARRRSAPAEAKNLKVMQSPLRVGLPRTSSPAASSSPEAGSKSRYGELSQYGDQSRARRAVPPPPAVSLHRPRVPASGETVVGGLAGYRRCTRRVPPRNKSPIWGVCFYLFANDGFGFKQCG